MIDGLMIYGLSPVQAQVYITLLKLGRSTAKAISINSDINRVDVYRAVKRLSKLGLIEQVLGKPIAFTAVDPDQALDILLGAKSSQVERLRSGKIFLKTRLEMLALDKHPKNQTTAEEEELFVNVLSGEQVFRRLKSMVGNSKKEVLTIFSPRSLILYDRIGIPELEQQQVAHGIRIRAITSITRDNYREATTYSRIVELRHLQQLSSHLRYTIVDHSLLLLPVADPPANLGEATALWTDSKSLIIGLVDDFERLWSNASPSSNRLARLQTML
jgi:sugar-specific transcriptional regulator TrmB